MKTKNVICGIFSLSLIVGFFYLAISYRNLQVHLDSFDEKNSKRIFVEMPKNKEAFNVALDLLLHVYCKTNFDDEIDISASCREDKLNPKEIRQLWDMRQYREGYVQELRKKIFELDMELPLNYVSNEKGFARTDKRSQQYKLIKSETIVFEDTNENFSENASYFQLGRLDAKKKIGELKAKIRDELDSNIDNNSRLTRILAEKDNINVESAMDIVHEMGSELPYITAVVYLKTLFEKFPTHYIYCPTNKLIEIDIYGIAPAQHVSDAPKTENETQKPETNK